MSDNGDQQHHRQKAVFLDKDGTLIKDVPYNVDPAQIQLLPNTLDGLKALHQAGYKLIVITNQSGVARGYFQEADLARVEDHLRRLLAAHDIPLTDFFYCPHHVEGIVPGYTVRCECRKPEPGLVLQAAKTHNIDCQCSWFIGDILDDVEAGRRAGCQTILLNSGGETEWKLSPQRLPHYIVNSFVEAARIITTVGEATAEAICVD